LGNIQNPVSLRQITSQIHDPLALASELHIEFMAAWEQLRKEGFSKVLTDYNENLYKIGEQVKLKKGSRHFEAIIKGVSPLGKLVIQHGIEEEMEVGQVEWVT